MWCGTLGQEKVVVRRVRSNIGGAAWSIDRHERNELRSERSVEHRAQSNARDTVGVHRVRIVVEHAVLLVLESDRLLAVELGAGKRSGRVRREVEISIVSGGKTVDAVDIGETAPTGERQTGTRGWSCGTHNSECCGGHDFGKGREVIVRWAKQNGRRGGYWGSDGVRSCDGVVLRHVGKGGGIVGGCERWRGICSGKNWSVLGDTDGRSCIDRAQGWRSSAGSEHRNGGCGRNRWESILTFFDAVEGTVRRQLTTFKLVCVR